MPRVFMSKPTVGSFATDLMLKTPEITNVIEQMYANLTDYEKNIKECVETHRKGYGKDFFVIVINKKEALMHNVMRNYFIGALAAPTPTYDQTVYKYHYIADELEFLWVIPDRDTCFNLLRDKDLVVPSERPLLEYIIKFRDGTLLKECMKHNNEKPQIILGV